MPRPPTGRPRGRPRHPEPLTPAEQRVRDLLREGLANGEIAVRLGISPETVKTHVSNMLSKLGLASRQELAAWEPGKERVGGHWWERAGALLALAGLARGATRPLMTRVAPLALVGAVAGAAALLAVSTQRDGGPQTPTPTATPTAAVVETATVGAAPPPTATPTPSPMPEPEPATVEVGSTSRPLMLGSPRVEVIPIDPSGAPPGQGQLVIHDLQAGESFAVPGTGLAWRPGTETGAIVLDDRIALYDAMGRTWRMTNVGGGSAMTWSHDGSRLAVGGPRDEVRILDLVAMTVTAFAIKGTPGPWSSGRHLLPVASPRGLQLLRLEPPARRLPVCRASEDVVRTELCIVLGWLDERRFVGWGFGNEKNPKLRVIEVGAAGVSTLAERPVHNVYGPTRPWLSPDGARIVLQNSRDEMFLLDAESLADLARLEDVTLVDVTADGERLLVVLDRCEPEERLAVRDAASGDDVVVADTGGYQAGFSSDGRWVAYTEHRSLYLVPVDGSQPARQLFEPVYAPRGASWSDSSRFLAFYAFSDGYGRCE